MYSSSLSLTWFKRILLYYYNMIPIVYIIDIYRTSGSSTSLQTTDSFHHTVAKLCFLHLVHLKRDIDCGHHTLMSLNKSVRNISIENVLFSFSKHQTSWFFERTQYPKVSFCHGISPRQRRLLEMSTIL